MFTSKNKKESITIHPGIYQFKFPYFSQTLIPDEKNMIKCYYCDVKIIIGDDKDLNEGKLVTVAIYPIKGTIGTTNFYEHIASMLRNGIILSLFPEYKKEPISSEEIRWIEIYSKDYSPIHEEEFTEVEMEWDEATRRYNGYKTNRIAPEDRFKLEIEK